MPASTACGVTRSTKWLQAGSHLTFPIPNDTKFASMRSIAVDLAQAAAMEIMGTGNSAGRSPLTQNLRQIESETSIVTQIGGRKPELHGGGR